MEERVLNNRERKKFLVDILARMSQVIFTLLVVTPFIQNVFNWLMIVAGLASFVLIILIGSVVAGSIEEVR
jgi:hypothetical protein